MESLKATFEKILNFFKNLNNLITSLIILTLCIIILTLISNPDPPEKHFQSTADKDYEVLSYVYAAAHIATQSKEKAEHEVLKLNMQGYMNAGYFWIQNATKDRRGSPMYQVFSTYSSNENEIDGYLEMLSKSKKYPNKRDIPFKCKVLESAIIVKNKNYSNKKTNNRIEAMRAIFIEMVKSRIKEDMELKLNDTSQNLFSKPFTLA